MKLRLLSVGGLQFVKYSKQSLLSGSIPTLKNTYSDIENATF